jgi:Restriction endonuclease/TIR domain
MSCSTPAKMQSRTKSSRTAHNSARHIGGSELPPTVYVNGPSRTTAVPTQRTTSDAAGGTWVPGRSEPRSPQKAGSTPVWSASDTGTCATVPTQMGSGDSSEDRRTRSASSRASGFDVFFVYAREDRAVARPIAEELVKRGWRVWFDEFELTIGDSLAGQIDRGLSQSHAAVALITPSFFQKHWPARELSGLAMRESEGGAKIVLPVWHEVDASSVARHSPVLADRVAVNTSSGLQNVVHQIEVALKHSLDLVQPGSAITAVDHVGNPLELGSPERAAFDLQIASVNDAMISRLSQNPHMLYALEPRRFEELVAAMYEKAGFEVELTPASGDHGVDVYAIRRHSFGSTLIVVQAKRYKPTLKVTAAQVRELYGVVNLQDASAGVLITTSSFEPGAEQVAAEHRWRLELRDYARLQDMLRAMRAGTKP